MPSITTIEKGVTTWAKKLRKQGFDTDIEVFKGGRGNAALYGPSYVELHIEITYYDADYEGDDTYYDVFKFEAGGWYSREPTNARTWGGMKKKAIAILRLSLPEPIKHLLD